MIQHDESSRLTRFRHDSMAFDVVDRGRLDAEVAICLHGFPQTAACWDAVADQLVAADLRVVTPNQRGYSPGARPLRRRDYTLDTLAGDVLAMADALGRERVHVVGHDWGGIVAWHLASAHPERVATLTAVSTPHPRAFVESIVRSDQMLHSWYMLALQAPKVPERVFRLGGGARMRSALEESGLHGESLDTSMRLLTQPESARAMVNWYRGLPLSMRASDGVVTVPTTYIWGPNDPFLGRCAAERTANWVSAPYTFIEVSGGTHWLPETHPDVIADAVCALVSTHPSQNPAH